MFDHFVKGCDMMRHHGAESIARCRKISILAEVRFALAPAFDESRDRHAPDRQPAFYEQQTPHLFSKVHSSLYTMPSTINSRL
jgi:hypothetical protein